MPIVDLRDLLVVVPVPLTLVRGQESAKIVVRSCCVAQPLYLVVPRSIAPDFQVEDVFVGKNAQFKWEGGVPAEVFAGDVDVLDVESRPLRTVELDHPVPLKLDVMTPDRDLAIWVRNLNPVGRYFAAAVFAREIC